MPRKRDHRLEKPPRGEVIDKETVRLIAEAHHLPTAVVRSIAIALLRAVRLDLAKAATALDASPTLGTAARTLSARLSYALQRIGDLEEFDA